jgi:hypothetical protein
MLQGVDWQIVSEVSEERFAFIILQDTVLRNVGHDLPDYKMSHPIISLRTSNLARRMYTFQKNFVIQQNK